MAIKPSYQELEQKVKELEKEIAKSKSAEEKISKLNKIFDHLGVDPKENIDVIVRQTCEILEGICSIYNRLDDEEKSMYAWSAYNLPPGFDREDAPDGHICYEATIKGKENPVVIEDLEGTTYEKTDPNVKKYALKSYLGFPVSLGNQAIGSLCIVDVKKRRFSPTEIHIISTLAKALSLELNREQAKEALRESEERFRTIFENAQDSIFIKDKFLRYRNVNPAMVRLFKLSTSELIGRHDVELFGKEAGEHIMEGDFRVLGGKVIEDEHTKPVRGMPKTFHVIKVPIKDASEKVIGLCGIARDITERKRAEEELREAHDGLELKVTERTAELVRSMEMLEKEIEDRKQAESALIERGEELETKTHELEEVNAALKVLLKHRDEDKKEFEEKILVNVKKLVLPYFEKLANSRLTERQMVYLNIIKSNLEDIITPFIRQLSSRYSDLTPSEIQIAGLIKDGKTTKEIAELLNLSTGTIDFHRNNLRKKLGLRNTKTNLRSFLLSHT